MTRNRDPYETALASLVEAVQTGRLRGGEPVIVTEEAQRLRLSTTPVREALARLNGEGLVERAVTGGYVVARSDAAAVRDRYALRAHYLAIAVGFTRETLGDLVAPPLAPPSSTAPAVDRLFHSLVRGAGNVALTAAFDQLARHLELLKRSEALLFPDQAAEAEDLRQAANADSDDRLLQRIAAYHRRRMAAAPTLVRLAQDESVEETSPSPEGSAGNGD